MSQPEFTATLQSASQSWSTFSLETKKSHLEKSATQTKANHQQSLKTRKTLADTTKAFKKTVKQIESILSKNDKSGSSSVLCDKFSSDVKSVVKMYQEEIDVLTKRCKASDNICLDLYKSMVELPDPSPLLSNAVTHVQSFEEQIQHLLKGMEEMHKEVEKQHSNIQSLEYDLKQSKQELETTQKDLLEKEKKNEYLTDANQKLTKDVNQNTNTIVQNKEEKEELISLRREVAEYEVEFKNLKNQDITIKKLNARIEELIENQENEMQRELKKAQEHLAQTEGRRATEALEREATMARKLASLELELKAERAGSQAAQTHLLEADQGQHEREAVWEAQRQILVDDADRLRELLDEASRERDSLKMRVEALSGTVDGDEGENASGGGVGSVGAGGVEENDSSMVDIVAERKAYEAEVGELTLNISAMRDEIRTKDDTMFKLQSSMQATIESLESERGYLANKVTQLETQISSAPSKDMIDNMRRELRILKKLEYNAVDIDAEKEEPELTNPTNEADGDDLETVLIGKLRKVETDLVKERREKSAHYEECQKLQEQVDVLVKGKSEAESLVARLEADLEKAISVPSSAQSDSRKLDTEMKLNTTSDPSTLQHILDPNSAPAPKASSYESKAKSDSAVEKRNDDHSVATIVMAQRDRLRARCEGLEAERDGFKRELQIQVSTAESLKSDNTKLYEKVRYLQNYNNTGLNVRSRGDRDLDLEALEQRYEASVDPFKQFSRNERQRKLKEMSPMEKTVFVVARTVLGSKEMRTALFFYVSILHLLVFATTYHWSHGCSTVTHHSAIDSLHAGIPDIEGAQP